MKIYKIFFYLCCINNFAYSMKNAVNIPLDNYQMYASHDKSKAGKKINLRTSNSDYSNSGSEILFEEEKINSETSNFDHSDSEGENSYYSDSENETLTEEKRILGTSNFDDDSDDSDYSNSGSGILFGKEEDTQPELNSNNTLSDINNIGKGVTPETEEALRKLRSVGNFHIKKIGSIVVISIAFIIYKLKSKKGKKESNVDNKNNFICSHNHR